MTRGTPNSGPRSRPTTPETTSRPNNPESYQPPVGPALSAYYRGIAEHKIYAKVGDNVKARLRPGIAMRVIRDAVTRRGMRTGDPLVIPYFDDEDVKRNIAQLQDNYGPLPTGNRERDRNRSQALRSRMDRAHVYDELSGAGLASIHEINAAYTLYEQSIVAEDKETQDSLEILIAAYGMSLDNLHHQEMQ